jgi:hypothetical protein
MDVPGDHPHSGGDPILRSFQSETRRVYALGGLHYLRGNSAPYFSLTIASWRIVGFAKRSGEDSFGAAHDEILRLWPELAPLAALHLSDWTGAPMHAKANGFYQLAGYGGGLGAKFHAGNAEHLWCAECHGASPKYSSLAPPRSVCPHQREKCLAQWAAHVRLPLEEARGVADAILREAREAAARAGYFVNPYTIHALACEARHAKRLHAAWVTSQRERWQREADACVEALGIRYYYGDRMPAGETASASA